MSFFNRSKDTSTPRPDPRTDQYSRLPPRNPGLPTAPNTQGRVPPPDHYEKRAYDNGRPSQGRPEAASFDVVSTPSDVLALSNRIVMHPRAGFRDGEHVLVKQTFPLTVKLDDTNTLQPNQLGTSVTQRQWIGLSKAGDVVSVQALPPHLQSLYLQQLDLETSFIKKNQQTSEQFSVDEMTKVFVRLYTGTMFGVGEILLFDFHGHTLKLIVKSLSCVELPQGAMPESEHMGIVMEKTDVNFIKASDSLIKFKASAKKPAPNAILAPNFKFEDMGIGGLDEEFSSIFRRAFASRVFPPGLVEKLGIQHVKGILLFGPPGTGKTLMARQIGKMLNAREPKIVNGPEILNKYVGASEENIRKLFADAEAEYKAKGDESGLHIIIFDELDAICKQRGSSNSGTGVGDSVVNQLLSKMDGVDQLNNILIIGMTNRKDMIDEALLRAGRLEVHMEISLPDEKGRLQILNIHTTRMRNNHLLERDVNLEELAAKTKNFSGAEIAGLIKSATSFAFNRHVKVGSVAAISDDIDKMRVNRDDFTNALDEVHADFGVSEEEINEVVPNGIIVYDAIVTNLLHDGELFVEQVQKSARTRLVSVLLHGPPGSGKTAIAATIARRSDYPFIKLISPDSMVGMDAGRKIAAINKVFQDSYKSPLSVIVIDNIERLLEWVPIGPIFSNAVLQALLVLLGRQPPKGRRLLILATTSIRSMLVDTQLPEKFDKDLWIPPVSTLPAFEHVVREVDLFRSEEELRYAMRKVQETGFGSNDDPIAVARSAIGIKRLLSIIESARQEPENVAERLASEVQRLKL